MKQLLLFWSSRRLLPTKERIASIEISKVRLDDCDISLKRKEKTKQLKLKKFDSVIFNGIQDHDVITIVNFTGI